MPNVLTASPDPTYAYVLLRSEFTAIASQTATVERSIDGGVTWQLVRGGNPLMLVGPDPAAGPRIGYLYDAEAPLDVALQYRSTSNTGVITLAGPVTIASNGYAWLKDPARPWANLRVDFCLNTNAPAPCLAPLSEPAITLVAAGLGTETRASDATLFPILNRARPADVFAYRKAVTTSWRLVSKTLASMNSLEVFYAWGGPIFIQLPPVYGWPDRYYQPGDTEVSRLSVDLTRPYRFWDVPLTEVDAPVGAAQGTATNNWCLLKATYATWDALAATGLTWGDVMEGDAAPPPADGYGAGLYGDGPYGDGG
jgi:hypothetical protein